MKVECSLCGQQFNFIYLSDWSSLYRHELGRHTKHTVYSERDGSKSKPMGNFIYGNVVWKIIKIPA